MDRADPETLADGQRWEIPESIERRRIDTRTGFLATAACPDSEVREEFFRDGSAPEEYCPIHGGNLLERIAAELRAAFGRETARRLDLPPR